MATYLPSCCSIDFLNFFPGVSSKLYFVEICYVSEKLWLFNHKELIFGFQILDLKDRFSASLTGPLPFDHVFRIPPINWLL